MRYLKSPVLGILGAAAACAVALSACQTTIPMDIMQPGEVNLKGVSVIAIGNSTGENRDHAQDLANRLNSALFESNYFKKVIDRSNLDTLAKEKNLSLQGLTDDKYTTRVGKIIGGANLVFLAITADKYNEETNSQNFQVYNSRTKSNSTRTVTTRTGKHSLAFSMRVVNTETSEILASKVFSLERVAEESSDHGSPASIDRQALYDVVMKLAVRSARNYLVPHMVTVDLEYLEGSDLPKRETIRNYMRAGETDTALGLLIAAAKKDYPSPKVKAMALYNYGIILVYMGKSDEGIALLKEAIALDEKKKLYFDSLQMAKNQKAAELKLKTQLK